jgi:hypothetical protein
MMDETAFITGMNDVDVLSVFAITCLVLVSKSPMTRPSLVTLKHREGSRTGTAAQVPSTSA